MAGSESLRWRNSYRSVEDGEQVRASVTNRAPDDLWGNLLYLKNILDTMTAGKALVLPGQSLSSAALVGTPVYLDTSFVWQPALAELASSPNSTLFQLTEKAYVMGVVMAKSSSVMGDVVMFGEITFAASVLNRISGAYSSGSIYYLSPYFEGMLTASRGVAPVRVCIITGPDADGNYRMLVNPEQRSQLESHGHYHLVLEDAPAGVPNCVPHKEGFLWGELESEGPYPGVVHIVEEPDVSAKGWLPADHSSFENLVKPDGAKFGYNIAADTDLQELWPPLPVDHVYVEVDGIGEVNDLIVVNSDGIWWMDDSYGKAPWPVNLPCGSSDSPEGSSSSSSSETEYPLWPVRIELWFTRVMHGATLTSISNHIESQIAVMSDLTPRAVGADIAVVSIADTCIKCYQLGYVEGSSDADANTLLYCVPARDFSAVAGRQPNVSFELVLGASDATIGTSIASIIDGLTLSVSRLTAAAQGSIAEVSSVVTADVLWDSGYSPDSTAVVPAGEYFTIRSEALELNAGELLFLKLTWDPAALGYSEDLVYLFAIRPLVALSE